jgi:hypothetical protein
LHQFFNILIKKGRGIWPDEALATLTVYATVMKVPTPSTPSMWKDKSAFTFDILLQYLLLTIFKSTADLSAVLFLCPYLLPRRGYLRVKKASIKPLPAPVFA